MTNAKCVQTCSDLGYNYAGTEFGHECCALCDFNTEPGSEPLTFLVQLDCGNTTFAGSVEEKSDGFCHMACLGEVVDACGGYNHVSLYKRPGVVGGWP